MAADARGDSVRWATAISSTLLRSLAWIFLRWIPGPPLLPIIYTLFAIYIPSFLYEQSHTQPFNVISDEIKITTIDAGPQDAVDVDPRYANGDAAQTPGQELVVEEDVEIEAKGPEIGRTLLTGRPSPTSYLWSAVTFAINLALVLMTLDVVYRARYFYPSHDVSFSRVGYVSDTTASILVRQPDPKALPIFLSYRRADIPSVTPHLAPPPDTAWKSGGQIDRLDERTDFTGTLTLRGLKHDTRYEYVISNHTGAFTTSPRVGQLSDRAASLNTFTFVHSSCLKLNFPYKPFGHPLASAGLKHLGQAMSGLGAQFMLFLGDFIYIDVPWRHGRTVEDYRREYRQVYASPDWAGASASLPWIHVYDDHELENDWDRNTTGLYAVATDPYAHYHTAANPPAVRAGGSYFAFDQGPASFFVLDTRRYRSRNDGTDGAAADRRGAPKTMLGPQQLADLLAWLARPAPRGVRWKIVVSSVPFTKNWWSDSHDSWRGYVSERQQILEAMWDVGARRTAVAADVGVVVLSGDRHEFAATAFPPPPGQSRWPPRATVHEFSASPLGMFNLPVRTYVESTTPLDGGGSYVSDVCVKYIPGGTSKFGAISIAAPRTSDQSVLTYRLFVDGLETWSYTLTTPYGGRADDAIWG